MNRLVVMLSVSLDGFFEGPGADISWHRVSVDLHRDLNAMLEASGGPLNGRRNWELMASFWPHVDSSEPEVMREFPPSGNGCRNTSSRRLWTAPGTARPSTVRSTSSPNSRHGRAATCEL